MPTGIYKRTKKLKKQIVLNIQKYRFKKGHKVNVGRKFSKETRRKMSEAKKGKPSWYQIQGVQHPSWKGGITKTAVKRWVMKNREHKNYLNRRRRAMKYEALGFYTLGEWELLKKQYGYTCPCCGKKEPEIKLTEDHIIPLSKGGTNWIDNIQPLCKSCNSKKHTKIIKY